MQEEVSTVRQRPATLGGSPQLSYLEGQMRPVDVHLPAQAFDPVALDEFELVGQGRRSDVTAMSFDRRRKLGRVAGHRHANTIGQPEPGVLAGLLDLSLIHI